MKSFLAYALGLCAASVALSVAEPVVAWSNRAHAGMGHGKAVHRGAVGHRQGFRSGASLPSRSRGGVALPRHFRSGVTLPRDFRSGVTLRRGAHRGAGRQKNRVKRRAMVQRHDRQRRRGFSSSRHANSAFGHRGSNPGRKVAKRQEARKGYRVDKGYRAKRRRSAAKHFAVDKPYAARKKRYEVVDWKRGDRRYRDAKFASAAKKHTGRKRHQGKKRYRVEDWKGKKGHHKVKKRGKHTPHTRVTHIHRRHGFSAGVFYAVPPTEVYVVNANEEYDDCRKLTELGHDASGRPALVRWTLCFDEYGEPYIPEDGRHVITLY